jgi:hypothetical protein
MTAYQISLRPDKADWDSKGWAQQEKMLENLCHSFQDCDRNAVSG